MTVPADPPTPLNHNPSPDADEPAARDDEPEATSEPAALEPDTAQPAPVQSVVTLSQRPVPTEPAQRLRLLEAMLFAATEPVDEAVLSQRFGPEVELAPLLQELRQHYAGRGIQLVRMEQRWAFRTAPDLGAFLRIEQEARRKPSRAAIETLAIIAYHQPVTRAEIESIRAVATSKGTLDLLLEAGWIKPGRRRETPGRPLTWVTSDHFLDYFSLESLRDLPGVEELKAAGLLDARPVLSALPGAPETVAPARDSDEGGT